MVGAGGFGSTFYDVDEEGLETAVRGASQGFLDFFIPNLVNGEEPINEAVAFCGLEGWRVQVRVEETEEEPEKRVVFDMIGFSDPASYVVSFATASSDVLLEVTDSAMESVAPAAELPGGTG